MFASLPPVALESVRSTRTVTGNPPSDTARRSLDEAYELRLLAEVARWDDHGAFEQIFVRHQAAVMRVALRVCRDRWAAEDIVQQTFMALWVRAGRLVEKSLRLRSWLTTVARNAAVDYVRAHRHTEELKADSQLLPQAAQPDEISLARESQAAIAQALRALPDSQRAAIELVYFAGMTYESAAAELDRPVSTIKSRVRLAQAHLRDLLLPHMR